MVVQRSTPLIPATLLSTRRCPWDAKLGYQPQKLPLVPLHTCLPGGGPLPCTLVLIQRVYPSLYWLAARADPGGGNTATPGALTLLERTYDAEAEKVDLLFLPYLVSY